MRPAQYTAPLSSRSVQGIYPLCKLVTCGALTPVTAAVRVHSTLHCTPVSPVYVAHGPWLRQWRALDASRVRMGNRSTPQ